MVSGRCLDRLARHHRRHDGEQLLRRPVAALRQHARECASRSTPCSPTAARRISARWRRTCPMCRTLRRCSRWRGTCSRIGAREADEIAARFPKVQRRVGGYNHRCAGARPATTSTSRIFWSARRHARLFDRRSRLKLSPLLGTPRRRRRAISAASTRRWTAAQHIVRLEPIAVELVDADHDRRSPATSRCSGRRLSRSCKASPQRCCWSSSARTTTTRTCAA